MSKVGGPSADVLQFELTKEPKVAFLAAADDFRASLPAVEMKDYDAVNAAMARNLPVLRLAMPQLAEQYKVEAAAVFMRNFYDNLDDFATRLQGRSWPSAVRSYKKMMASLDYYQQSVFGA